MSDPIFGNLNERQAEAVCVLKGPLLIIAGAGSGKTRTLTHRIAHLIQQGVLANEILAVTFTNKAAEEMKRRIASLLKITSKKGLGFGDWDVGFPATKLPVMGTFHSICARILRRDITQLGRGRDFVIYDAEDQERSLKYVLAGMKIPETTLKPRTALAHISRCKCEALGPSEVAHQAQSDFAVRLAEVYRGYQTLLRTHNALDFDDLLLEVVRLFVEAPRILERYQEAWRFLNVDEYQDTNHAQYLVLSKLAEKYRNLCVIGDPDQSIYRFRGADVRNILEFQKDYPDAVRVTLDQNYRSTQPILSAADAVITPNPHRPKKRMWTERATGELVTLHEVRDEQGEAEEVLRETMQAKERQHVPWGEQVILYRTNAQSRLIEEACLKAGIPYRIVGGVKFYARREVKDILAYLMTIQNPSDAISLLRILNVPSRKIGKTTLERLQEFCREHHCGLWEGLRSVVRDQGAGEGALGEGVLKRIADFVALIERYREMRTQVNVSTLTRSLLHDIGMERWLTDDTVEGEERWGNVQELLSVMQKYDALPPLESMTSFLEEASLVSEVDRLIEARDDALTLMTMHLCKGLEYRVVHVVGCEEGLLPHAGSLSDREQLEEERRLLYVAMTRAKDHLHLFFAQRRLLFGELMTNEPSRFLEDIPASLINRRSFSIMSPYLWSQSIDDGSLRATAKQSSRSLEGLSTHSVRSRKVQESRMRVLHPDGSIETPETPSIEFNQDYAFADASQEEGPMLRKGMRVAHPSFGEGTVDRRSGDIVEITFDRVGKKRLALSIAPLRIVT